MAIKENSKKLNLGKTKSKTKKFKYDSEFGKSAPESPKKLKDNQENRILDSEQSKKNKKKIEIEHGTANIKKKKGVKSNIDEKIEGFEKINPDNDTNMAKNTRKRKLSNQESETKGESSDLDNFDKIKKSKKKKSTHKNLNEDEVETNNEISEEKNSGEILKPKKHKKRKLSETDIIDSDATDTEETPQKKKKKKVEKDHKNESEDPEVKARTVFVGNVPLKTTKKNIKKLFRKYGIIESVRIRGIPAANPKLTKRVAAIKQEFHPERNNFLCYIRYKPCFFLIKLYSNIYSFRYKNKEDAHKAEAENGVLFEGHHLRVHCCELKTKPDETKAIFIGNLSISKYLKKFLENFEQKIMFLFN